MIPQLEKKYKKKLSLNELREKDIIYFCRDSLHYGISQDKKEVYEKEILSLIKMKEWDWSVKDIDKNNMLLYPIYNGAFSIVKYLIENKKYNVQEYNEDISKAICSCIMPVGEKMSHYLLSKDIHTDYVSDMVFQAYSMSIIDGMKKEYVDYYINKARDLLVKKTNFNKILNQFLKTNEFDKYEMSLLNFLENHPLDKEKKLEIVKSILDEGQKKSLSFLRRKENKILDKWIKYIELNKNLPYKNTFSKKIKI